MTDEVQLRVNGVNYGGWLSVEINTGVERQARDYTLNITRSWPGETSIPRKVRPGDLCEVYIGADKVLTGYIDATPISYDGSSISVGVNGRSKTADLVDCAADFGSGQWRNRKIERIAADLGKPYGITVLSEVDTGAAITDHQIQPGETAYECIGRLLALRLLLSTDDAEGRLLLISPGSSGRASTSLVTGENILSADTALDYKDVFSEYVCKGQRAGNDDDFGDVLSASASERDTGVSRHRLMVIQQSGQVNTQICMDRVRYERFYRAAKALETSYTVAGWRQANGELWRSNQLVRVRDAIIGFDLELLITGVSYRLNEQGTTCMLTVAPASGFIPPPEAAKKRKKKKAAGSFADPDAQIVQFPVKVKP